MTPGQLTGAWALDAGGQTLYRIHIDVATFGMLVRPFATTCHLCRRAGGRSPMSASIHDKLNRVRKPRVHITYEVETEGAQIVRELPFVVGVLGDFSGDPTQPLRPLAERKFIQIDRDNFNDVMARLAPGLNLKVDNKLADDGTQMAVDLKFNSIEDFEPGRVVDQVPALKALLETRNKLRDLMSKVDRSEELETLLEQVLKNEGELKSLSGQLGLDPKQGA
jgi:type VI secretion system protein ImpB